MATEIIKQNDGNYAVNGKIVYKDSSGNWIVTEELTEREFTDFRRHVKIKEDNKRYYDTKK